MRDEWKGVGEDKEVCRTGRFWTFFVTYFWIGSTCLESSLISHQISHSNTYWVLIEPVLGSAIWAWSLCFYPCTFTACMDSCASTLTKGSRKCQRNKRGVYRKQFVPDYTDVFPDLRLTPRPLGQRLPPRETLSNFLKDEHYPKLVVRRRSQVGPCASWPLFLLRWNRPSSAQTWTPQASSQYLWTLTLLTVFLKSGKTQGFSWLPKIVVTCNRRNPTWRWIYFLEFLLVPMRLGHHQHRSK